MKAFFSSIVLAASLVFVSGTDAAVVYTYQASDFTSAEGWTGTDADRLEKGAFTSNGESISFLLQTAGDKTNTLPGLDLGLPGTLEAWSPGETVVILDWVVRGSAQHQGQAIGLEGSLTLGFYTSWYSNNNVGFYIDGSRVGQVSLPGVTTDSIQTFSMHLIKAGDDAVSLALYYNGSEDPVATLASGVPAWSTIAGYDAIGQRATSQKVGLSSLSIQVVPEPGAALLGLLGLGLLGYRRR